MDRDDWLCQPCRKIGRVTAATECDHIKPKAEGGTDDLDNLQAICSACHREKTRDESARAQGREPQRATGADGWPVDEGFPTERSGPHCTAILGAVRRGRGKS